MPLPFIILAAKAAQLIYKNYFEDKTTSYKPPPDPVIENLICFIGCTNSGKSSTANALLGFNSFKTGIQHGITTSSKSVDYKNNYKITDTPGLLDTINYETEIIKQVQKSRIIIYVSTGQLYQKELDFIDRLKTYYLKSHKLFLYVNKQDQKEFTMVGSQINTEKELVIKQVSKWIFKEDVAFGASSPVEYGNVLSPKIEELQNLIYKYIA